MMTTETAFQAGKGLGLEPVRTGGLVVMRCPTCGDESGLEARDGAIKCRNGCDVSEILPGAVVRSNGKHSANTERVVVAESFAVIRAQRTRWLWQGRIPLGAPTLLVGREKLGKSTLTVRLAAEVSRGTLAGDLEGSPADVLIVSYEDNARSTIKPRLLAANADPSRVHALSAKRGGVYDLVSLPDDVEPVREAVRERKARLLIVDPFSASLAVGIDSHRDGDMRRAIAALAQLAEDEDLAVALVAHFNKGTGGDSLTRVLGSRALTAASRSVLVFGRAPDAEDRSPDRVLAHSACNVAAEAPSLACRIEPRVVEDEVGSIETSRLVILGDCETQADDLLAHRGEDERSDREIAADWLTDELADGEWHEAPGIRASAKAAGVAERTLYRARKSLNVEDRRASFQGVSEWRLPTLPPPANEVGKVGGGTPGRTRTVEPNPGDSESLPCHTPVSGKVGPSGKAELAERVRGLSALSDEDAEREWRRLTAKFGTGAPA